jgi:hypothetical protein
MSSASSARLLIEFRLRVIYSTALLDAKCRAKPTVMAEVLTNDALADDEEKTVLQNNRLLLAIADRPDGSIAQWAQDCGWMTTAKPGERSKAYKSLVQRVLKRLTQDKRLKKGGASTLSPRPARSPSREPKTAPANRTIKPKNGLARAAQKAGTNGDTVSVKNSSSGSSRRHGPKSASATMTSSSYRRSGLVLAAAQEPTAAL